jgi:uncharacterized RDD family membrane protein YckC
MKTRFVLVLAMLAGSAAAGAQEIGQLRISVSNPDVRILQSFTLKAGETARQVVVLGGDATIAGRVDGDVVVVLGRAQLAATAVVTGSFVVVGGTGVITEGAQVHEDVFALGGLDAPPDFSPGRNHIAIGTPALGTRLSGLLPWLTRGLAFGRLIVPDLRWVWTIAAIFFLLNLLLNLLFDGPVRACATALHATPVSAFVTGLLVMLLAGPLCLLLAISVIGIAVIPFVIAALVLGTIVGRIGFARWLGMTMVPQADLESRAQALRSFVIGSVVMCVAYMIPLLGLLTWAMAAVFGLGAAMQAFARAYRRENPRSPRRAAPAAPPPPSPASAPVTAAPVEPLTATALDEPFVPLIPPSPSGTAATAAGAVDLVSFPRATFLERVAAFGLDLVLVVIAAQILRFDRLFEGDSSIERNLLLLAVVYHVAFWAWKQTTVGGIICQLRLVRTDGGPVRFPEALVRGLTGIFSLAVVGLGFFWILRDPERQAWHDRIAGTYVVKVPRNWPI